MELDDAPVEGRWYAAQVRDQRLSLWGRGGYEVVLGDVRSVWPQTGRVETGMDVFLWVVSVLLAVVFVGAGGMKLASSKAKLVESQEWAESIPASGIKTLGFVEVLAAVGLVVPPLVGIATVLVPLAASGVVVLMVGAAAVHLRRAEYVNVAVNGVFLGLALTIAILRFGPYAF